MAKHIRRPFPLVPGRIPLWSGAWSARLLLAMTALLLAACGGSNNQNLSQDDLGGVRVLNAIADSPILNFSIENSSIANLPYGQISGFSQTRDGRFDLDVRFTTLDGTATTLVDDFRTRVREQEQTTVVATGTVAAPVTFEFSAANPDVPTGSTEYHVINTAGAGALDVFLTAPSDNLGGAATSVANNAVSSLITTESGTRRLRITAAGNATVIYDSGSFELASGRRLIFHVQPYFGPGDGTVTVSNIEGSRVTGFANEQLPVSLRIANAIADVPGADAAVTIDGTTTDIADILSNSISTPQLFSAGSADLLVNMQTDPGTAFYADTQQLIAGERRTLLVAGSFVNGTTTGRLTLDPQRTISTAAQINVLQGTTISERVDLYLLSDSATTETTGPAITNLALLANTTREVLAGTYDVVITRTGENTTLAGPESITLTNGTIRTILLTDADGGGTPPRIIIGDPS